MKIEAIIFDLDGTIAAFNLDYMTLRSEVRSYLLRIGVPASILSLNESIFDMLDKTELFLKNGGKSSRTIDKVRGEAFAIAEKWELEAAKTTSLFPSVAETLRTLKKMKMKIGLCTVNSEKSTSYILKRFAISEYFDVVVPRNKVRHVKPSGEHLEAVLKTLNVSPESALFVGDSARDMECARQSKVIAVGLSAGVSTQNELMNAGADFLVTSIADLPNLVETARIRMKTRRKKESAPLGQIDLK